MNNLFQFLSYHINIILFVVFLLLCCFLVMGISLLIYSIHKYKKNIKKATINISKYNKIYKNCDIEINKLFNNVKINNLSNSFKKNNIQNKN